MWVLDPANSGELLDRLRPYSMDPDFEIVWCGEGWRALIGNCHDELVTGFPDYRFDEINQKGGVLAYQARPRDGHATAEEVTAVDEITPRFAVASQTVCEWCGRTGSLRSEAAQWQTLCDTCAQEMKTTKYPTSTPLDQPSVPRRPGHDCPQ